MSRPVKWVLALLGVGVIYFATLEVIEFITPKQPPQQKQRR